MNPNLKKIEDLFETRKLWRWLALRGADAKMREAMRPLLIGIQNSIYLLDEYGESHWQITQGKLDDIWSGIFDAIGEAGAGILHRAEVIKCLMELKEYQDIEVALRHGANPARVKISQFYYLKSCDLRLCRTIAMVSIPIGRPNSSETHQWFLHDVCGEICDDLDDMEEDLETWNCNRFMASIGTRGVACTYNEYRSFLEACNSRSLSLAASHFDAAPEIAQLTHQEIARAQTLLDKRIEEALVLLDADRILATNLSPVIQPVRAKSLLLSQIVYAP